MLEFRRGPFFPLCLRVHFEQLPFSLRGNVARSPRRFGFECLFEGLEPKKVFLDSKLRIVIYHHHSSLYKSYSTFEMAWTVVSTRVTGPVTFSVRNNQKYEKLVKSVFLLLFTFGTHPDKVSSFVFVHCNSKE